jgi:CheY-like chemotaxis protein
VSPPPGSRYLLGSCVDVQFCVVRYIHNGHNAFLNRHSRDRIVPPALCKAVFQLWTEIFMMISHSLVSIVDDDESVRESLPDLLKEFGLPSETFSSAEDFLARNGISRTKCLILDIAMPGMGGPELQQEMKRRKANIPIIFITARRDESVRSHLIEQGAIACLIKPFTDTALLDALNSALPAG